MLATLTIEYEPDIGLGPPVPLFDMRAYMATGLGRAWDVDPSGERFVMIRNASVSAQGEETDVEVPRIDVVLNWLEELKTRVPTD